MLKIAVYHWLPLADNMMPDIEKSLKSKIEQKKVTNINSSDREQLIYSVFFQSYEVYGKINNRGFVQHIFVVPEIPKKSLAEILNEYVPEIRKHIADFLFQLIPLAVKNKMAVLEERIVSFQEFEAKPFDALVDKSATTFLLKANVTAITFDEAMLPPSSFIIQNQEQEIDLTINPERSVCFSLDESIISIYSPKFMSEDLEDRFDNNIYYYCSTIAYMQFVSKVIDILKQVKDHMIPLRRQLSIALSKDTEEHFIWMTRLKKYLTYTNIKLPLMGKVLNHLIDAKASKQFVGSIHNLSSIPYIEDVSETHPSLSTYSLVTKIAEDIGKTEVEEAGREDRGRLGLLYDEDINEVAVLSSELAEVLQGSLMSENVQISNRDLDTQRVALELDRGGKNRANALKFLSIILSASLGSTIYDGIVNQEWLKLVIIAVIVSSIWIGIEVSILIKAKNLRFVIPFNLSLPRKSLENLANNIKSPKRVEGNGSRRIITWSEKFEVVKMLTSKKDRSKIIPLIRKWFNPVKFDLTIDYEIRGYVYSVSMEVEHSDMNFNSQNTRDLVVQLVKIFERSECLLEYGQSEKSAYPETSLLAEVLVNIKTDIDPNLVALNKILTAPTWQIVEQIGLYKAGDRSSLSKDDIEAIKDVIEKEKLYQKWLIDAENDKLDIPLGLLGAHNIAVKRKAIS